MQESNSRLMMGLGVFALGASMALASSVTPANAATPGYQPQGPSSSHSMHHGSSASGQSPEGQPATQSNPNQHRQPKHHNHQAPDDLVSARSSANAMYADSRIRCP